MKSKKWLISMGLAVVLVVAFALPACDGDGTEPVQRLTVGTLTDMPSMFMNPEALEYTNVGCWYSTHAIYEALGTYGKVGADPDDTDVLIPKLCTSYVVTNEERYHPINEVMQMAQVWTLTLREGVKWHDFATSGEYLDANDVKYTFENVLSPWDPSKPICWEEYWVDYEDTWWLNVTGTYEIELIYEHDITTAHPPGWWHWDPIVPEHVYGPAGNGTQVGWNEDPALWDGNHIGTGPWKYVDHKPDDYHHWERNDDWWGESEYGENEVEELWIITFPSMESLTAAFEAGTIDTYMSGFSYLKIPDYEAAPDITVEVQPGIAIYYLGFDLYTDDYWVDYGVEPVWNVTANPLHDKALRQAIAYAIDAQDIIDLVLGGSTYGELAAGWVYPESAGYNDELDMYAQNTTKAAELMVGAGYYQDGEGGGYLGQGKWVSNYTDETFAFTLTTTNVVSESDTGLAIKEDLDAFGIDITVATLDTGSFYDQIYDPEKDWELFVAEEEPSADPYSDWIWMLLTDPWGWGDSWAPSFWVNVEFNDGYELLYTAADPNVPRKAIQAIANEELPIYMLYREHVVSAYRTDKWTGWYNELGGPAYWFNPWSTYEVHWVGD